MEEEEDGIDNKLQNVVGVEEEEDGVDDKLKNVVVNL